MRFVDASEAFARLQRHRGVEVNWDEASGHVTVVLRLGRPATPREAVAAAISAANRDLGMVGFRYDGDDLVFSLAAFLDPDGRISWTVLEAMIATGRAALRSFAIA